MRLIELLMDERQISDLTENFLTILCAYLDIGWLKFRWTLFTMNHSQIYAQDCDFLFGAFEKIHSIDPEKIKTSADNGLERCLFSH